MATVVALVGAGVSGEGSEQALARVVDSAGALDLGPFIRCGVAAMVWLTAPYTAIPMG